MNSERPEKDTMEEQEEVKVDPQLLLMTEEQPDADPEKNMTSPGTSIFTKICNFYTNNSFLILVVIVILLAYAYPKLGAEYLYPQYTATWIAVIIIFFLSGISLKSEEFKNAFKRLGFNIFVQTYNFGFVSVLMFGATKLIVHLGIIAQSLGDGMIICSCVPITVNMVLVLTKSSKGDEASAIFNAAFGNLMGVFISPLLILLYLGQKTSVDLGNVFFKLALRVLVPILIGQIIHRYVASIVSFVKAHKKKFKKVQEYCLIFIVYTVFCRTFSDEQEETQTSATDAILMIIFQFIILSTVMIIAWMLLKVLFPDQPALRVMGLYGCTHKSVAMGIPLINAIYEDDPNIGFYTLPLLIWYPMELVIGTLLSPRLSTFVTREEERLQTDSINDV